MVAATVTFMLCCGGTLTVAGIWAYDRYASDGVATDDPGGGPDDSIDPGGPVVWSPLTQGTDAGLDSVWSDLADEFTATGPGAGGNDGVELQPLAQATYRELLEAQLAAGTAPDLFHSWGGGDLRRQVAAGQVRDLTDELADVIATLTPAALSPYTIDGRVYGLPYSMGVVGFWFNRALFADAGLDPDRPPETWAQLQAAIVALDGAGHTPIALAGADDWTGTLWYGCLATRMAGSGAVAAAHQQRSLSESPDFEQAAGLLAELVAGAPFQPGYEAASYIGVDGQASLVANGEAAMELMGSWAPGVYEFETESGAGLGEDLGWFPFPEVAGGRGAPGEAYVSGNGFVVGVDAPDLAVDLLRFIFSEESHGRVLAADSALMSTRAGATGDGDPLVAAQLAAVQAAPAGQLFLDQDLPPPVGAELTASIGALVRGQLDPAAAIAQVTAAYQREAGD